MQVVSKEMIIVFDNEPICFRIYFYTFISTLLCKTNAIIYER